MSHFERRCNVKNIKIELVDNDHVVRAKTDLGLNGNDESFGKFIRRIKEVFN